MAIAFSIPWKNMLVCPFGGDVLDYVRNARSSFGVITSAPLER